MAAAVVCGFGTLATTACAYQPPAPRPEVRAVAIAGDASGGTERLGELRLDGAWSLAADEGAFGGISGARLHGDRLLLLSDRSELFELAWPAPPAGRSFAASLLAERTLADRRGHPLDAEALTVAPDGRWLVADEGGSRVVAFAAGRAIGRPIALPELASPAGANTGVEAVELLPGGALVALAEAEDAGIHAGVLITGTNRRRLRYRAAEGFRPTDLAAVPPWLFVLERRVSLLGGWQARLVAVPLAALEKGSDPLVAGRELATVSGVQLGENYEALAAAREPDGVRLLAVADDNFNGFQRTLLLSLHWRAENPPVAAAAVSCGSGRPERC